MSDRERSVLTQHNDNARTGAYLRESVLTPTSVRGPRFRRLYERNVNGDQLAQILYARGVRTRLGAKNLFFVATSTNEVYAFDADDESDGWFQLHPETVFDRATQQVAAVSRAAGNLDLFVIGFDNAVWSTFWNSDVGWNPHGWFQLHPETVFDHTTQQIAAVSRAPGNLDLFVIGFDEIVWSTFWNDRLGWNPEGWRQVRPEEGHNPAPRRLGQGKVVVYGLAKDALDEQTSDMQAKRPAARRYPARPATIADLRAAFGGSGLLATPLDDEIAVGDERGGRRQEFIGTISTARQRVSSRHSARLAPTFHRRPTSTFAVRASVFWSPETGAHIVAGDIRQEYLRQGGPLGDLGYPIASETHSEDHHGRLSRFENGTIVWYAESGAHTQLDNA